MTQLLHSPSKIRVWCAGALAAVAIGLATSSFSAEVTDWPKEVKASEGTVVIYQPQPEKLQGNVITGRAAMSLELANKKEPIFGAFWFTAKLDTDKDSGISIVRDVRVTKVRWPEMKEGGAEQFTKIVEAAVPTAGYQISTERLSASLATAAREQKSLAELKNDPPKMIFSEKIAVLLLYDGEPKFSKIENSDYERAVNTSFAVARNSKTKLVYLSSGNWWYEAKNPLGPWSSLMTPPADLVKMMPAPDKDKPEDKKASGSATMPEIVVSTTPTELIVSSGKPNWTSLAGGQLLYVKNTETPWVRDLAGNNMYVLLSGRWFTAADTSGPWTFVRPDKLPAGFKDIPPDSEIGGVRVSVAGTDEANDAVLDSQIPQTAAIKRKDAKLEVKYDGSPKFDKIAGTSVSYAVNTATQVLEIGGRYYAVDSGVWFTSAKATGPWAVADKIPSDEIQKIPPSSPVYNTTYVHIYESTPEVVYVGYTPGYMWSYPYYGVPVYGTGWYYPPYFYGPIYYPRPCTWGLHVGYNPWTGWNMGMSWSNGFVTVGIGFGGRPYPCCGGFYGGGYHGNNTTIINTGNINIGNSVGGGNRPNGGRGPQVNPNINNNGRGNNVGNNNVYNRAENKGRVSDRSAQAGTDRARPSTRENNVYADQNGNVGQRNGDQWKSRDQGSWNADQSRQNFDRNEGNRAYESRQSGGSREMSRGMSRGGGGRRR